MKYVKEKGIYVREMSEKSIFQIWQTLCYFSVISLAFVTLCCSWYEYFVDCYSSIFLYMDARTVFHLLAQDFKTGLHNYLTKYKYRNAFTGE